MFSLLAVVEVVAPATVVVAALVALCKQMRTQSLHHLLSRLQLAQVAEHLRATPELPVRILTLSQLLVHHQD
jgi:hypothetical protein